MEKKAASAIMLTLLLTSMLTLAFNIQPVKAEPRTWIVDDNGAGDFNTIQQAIDAASDGDIIFVCNGTYYEHLTIDKSLSLIGESKWYTTIDGNSTGDVVSITSNDTKIVNFTIQYGYSGISLLHCRDNNISSNILLNNYKGVAVNCSSNNLIFHNDLMNNTQQVYDYSWDNPDYPPSTNMWDDGYPSGGNYWSQYTGNDTYSGPFQNITCSDGIGDTPYKIDQNNEDRYPLMLPWDDAYNHQAAYDYAYKYAYRVCSDEYYWYYPDYPPWWWPPSQPLPAEPHYDCAHFVSCSIGSEPHETGGGLIVPSRTLPAYGEPGVGRLKDWLLNSSGLGIQKSSVSELIRGDVIFYRWAGYSWGGGGVYGERHSALYCGNGLVSSHDYSRRDEPGPVGYEEAVFVHIKGPLPQVSTMPATGVGSTYATLNGYLDFTGGETCEVWFVWDTTSHSSYVDYSHSTSHQPDKTSAGSFSQYISGLTPGVTYHFRAVAKNYEGTVKGADLTFIQPPKTLTIQPPSGSGSTNPGIGTYTYNVGTDVPVTAYPSSGWILDHWELDGSNVGSANPYHVIMNNDHTLKAVFTQLLKSLTIQVSGSGTTNPVPGTYQYSQGTNVQVTAYPSGSNFDHWELDSVNVGSANPYTVTMNDNHVLKAVFTVPPPPTITFYTDPSDKGSITFAGAPYTNGQSGQYAVGSYPVSANAPSGWTFSQWQTTGGVSISGSTATVTGAGTVKAVFTPPPTANVVFYQVGIDTDFTGTVLTVDGVNYGASAAAAGITITKNVGDSISFTYHSPLDISTLKRYVWTHTLGLSTAQSGMIQVPSGGGSVTGYYKTQYKVTFAQTELDNTAIGTVVTVAGVLKTYTDLPFTTDWADHGFSLAFGYSDIVASSVSGKQFKLVSVSHTSPLTVTAPTTVTGNYKTQYQITVTASPAEALGGTFKVTYTQCGTTYTDMQKTTSWSDWADAGTTVTVSDPQDVINSKYKFDHYDPSQSVTMNAAKTITLFYRQISGLSVSISPTTAKIKVGESVTFTSTVSGGEPSYRYQWYVNGSAVSGATSPTWTFAPVTTGYYIVYLNVTDSAPKTAESNEASVTVAPPLTVSISPMSASILVGQSVTFTSTVSGGYAPYSYQWYLDGTPVSGATTSTWVFTPTTSGIYYVYLKVTDDNNNVAPSETARITVSTVPVGGYSIPIQVQTRTQPIIPYIASITILTILFTKMRPKTKRKH